MGISFSSGILNETRKIFLATNGLALAKTALINETVRQAISVLNLDKVKNWKNMKKSLPWVNLSFEEHNKTFCLYF